MNLEDDVFRVNASWAGREMPTGVVGVAGVRAQARATVPAAANVITTFIDGESGAAKNGPFGAALILPARVDAIADHGHLYGLLTRDVAVPVTWNGGTSWSKELDFATPETRAARTVATAARLGTLLVASAGAS